MRLGWLLLERVPRPRWPAEKTFPGERVPEHGLGQMSCERQQTGEFVVRSGWTFAKYRTRDRVRRVALLMLGKQTGETGRKWGKKSNPVIISPSVFMFTAVTSPRLRIFGVFVSLGMRFALLLNSCFALWGSFCESCAWFIFRLSPKPWWDGSRVFGNICLRTPPCLSVCVRS